MIIFELNFFFQFPNTVHVLFAKIITIQHVQYTFFTLYFKDIEAPLFLC